MRFKIRNLLLFSLFIWSSVVNGQKIFREGYIIKNNGDTLNGLVQYEENQNLSQKCTFKRFDLAITIVYVPEMIKAFGYKFANHFETKDIGGGKSFLECLVKGKISLYASGKKLYVETINQELIELKSGTIKVKSPNEEKDYSDFRQLLSYIMDDVQGISIPSNLKLTDIAITPIVIKYNRLTNNNLIVYNRVTNRSIFDEATMLTGVNMSSYGLINVLGKGNTSLKAEITSSFSPVGTLLQNGNVWFFGTFYNTQLSRMNKRYSMQIELLFSKSNSFFYQELTRSYPSETHRIDILSNQSTIRIPFKIQYGIPLNKFTPYIDAGFSFNYNIVNIKNGRLEAETDTHQVYTYEKNVFLNRTKYRTISTFIGSGIKYKAFGSKFVFFEARVELDKVKSQIIAFDYANSAKLKLNQKLPLFSFLFGIGF